MESISREDFFKLARKYYQLSDKLDFIREKFQEEETDFDFFRYRNPEKELSEPTKRLIRKKFRVALTKFIKRYKQGEIDIPPALKILKEFQQNRADQQREINKMRNAYAMSMLMGEGFNTHEAGQNKDSKEDIGQDLIEGDKNNEIQERMKALQHFASLAVRIPDAKHSKSRQKRILMKLQEELTHETQLLESQMSFAQQNLSN